MRGQPWRYSGLAWRHGVMGQLDLAWPCACLLASRREGVRDWGAWGELSKTPPGGSDPVGGGGCSYPPLPTNFLPFRNVAHNATTTRASPTTTLTP